MLELKDIKGVGNSTLNKFKELEIDSVFELFSLFPRKYINLQEPIKITEIELNQYASISGRVESVSNVSKFGTKSFTIRFSDNLSENKKYFSATYFNMPFLQKTIKVGDSYRILAKFTDPMNLILSNPSMENENKISKLDGIYTVYPLKGVVGQNTFKNIEYSALDLAESLNFDGILGPVYHDIFNKFSEIHRPKSIENVNLALEELAAIDLAISLEIYRKMSKFNKKVRKVFYNIDKNRIIDFKNALNFTLTESQQNAINDINLDLLSKNNMSRILFGDVGSGKTIVAFYLMYLAFISGYQSIMMAPTEILVNQHAKNFEQIANKLNITYAVLTSSTPKAQRDIILEGVKNGTIKCLFGTQSLFSDEIKYKNLSVAIIDEQHRFGVNDRSQLEKKGAVDILSMTATPIPRSMALTFYENIDVSVIKKRENAISNINTSVVNNLDIALKTILALAMNKKQCFIVCPAIEDAEGNLMFSIETFKDKYLSKFKNVKVEFMHGKLKQDEKDEIMKNFSEGNVDVLVATSIIEVGIDTKATEMLIVNADRFGLASIHQLRGRIGRDGSLSHCILHTNNLAQSVQERLNTLVKSNDGQHIAEVDFSMRGPGDFLGTKQSGLSLTPIFKLNINAKVLNKAKIYSDSKLRNIELNYLLSISHKSREEVLSFIKEIGKVTLNS